ncbi:MAG TPA: tRNA threonylcarbamoyladenosine dehydratase [Pararobbsia sp.]|nr:tRNA threonylcarbamoyladenosine dehydratase [Pararobbsia sp.]
MSDLSNVSHVTTAQPIESGVRSNSDAFDAPDRARRFGGIARLYGPQALDRFEHAHVAVIGIGGVGSWVAEALARSAIGRLTLIDLDNVAESNTNRQIHALDGNFGKAKVTAMAERIRLIDPACRVTEIEDFIEPDNMDRLLGDGFDFVVDAIDSVRTKVALIAWCVAHDQALITVGGAGGQLDPTRLRIDDLAQTIQDPLLSKVRAQLRKAHGFPRGPKARFKVPAVYSDEPLIYPAAATAAGNEERVQDGSAASSASERSGAGSARAADEATGVAGAAGATGSDLVADDTAGRADFDVSDAPARGPIGLNCAGFGSSVCVTAPFGFAAASHVLRTLARAGVSSEPR